MARRPYPTDLSEGEWAMLAPLLPAAKPGGRPRSTDLREVLNAISYWLRSGEAWRPLPHDFPAWQTVYHYWRSWRLSGDWERIHAVLRERVQVRVRAGRAPIPARGSWTANRSRPRKRGACGHDWLRQGQAGEGAQAPPAGRHAGLGRQSAGAQRRAP